MMKMKAGHLLKYFRYILKNLYINVKLKCAVSWEPPFLPLIISSRLRLVCEPTARIKNLPGSYLRMGYGSGGAGVFEHTGMNLELYDASVLSLCGVSMLGFGSSICVYKNATLQLGDRTYLAGNALIKCAKSIRIGNNCAISWNVTILDSDFHPWSIKGKDREIARATTIEDHVWIGSNVIILKGVTIGEGSVVGGGSVVTKSVPKNCVVAGNPARIIHGDVSW